MDAKLILRDDLSEAGVGVYYSRYSLPLVDAHLIGFLKETAIRSPLKRARFCAHPSPDADQHDMLIVSHRDTYVAPHRHLGKSESFTVLEGVADIVIFGEQGAVEEVIKMGSASSGRPFFYRMPARKFHSMSIESDLLVFLESTRGPFERSDCEYASWAPDYASAQEGKAFIDRARQRSVKDVHQ